MINEIEHQKIENFVFVNEKDKFIRFEHEMSFIVWVGLNNLHFEKYMTRII
jgi:hypothetical protein